MAIRKPDIQLKSTLHVAVVFPTVGRNSAKGVPLTSAEAQHPNLPTTTSFANEAADLVLFPEGYIRASDYERSESLKKLATNLKAPLLVGAVDRSVDSTGRAYQVLLRFNPDGSCSRVYIKHSSANAVAFDLSDWEPDSMLKTFELDGVTVGATICHDHYLGLLPRFLKSRGAHLWVNPSDNNVVDIKWSLVLRLRAVENGFFALCTLHCDDSRHKAHPFAFAPDGSELVARQAGSNIERRMSECCEGGNIYMVDVDMAAVGELFDWSKLPPAEKPKKASNEKTRKPVRIGLSNGQPVVVGRSGQANTDFTSCIETNHGPVYVGLVQGEQVLDAAERFRVIDEARYQKATPIIWNHWEKIPTDSIRLATLMMGMTIECCTPIVISDGSGIHELIELANKNKIPARRVIEPSGDAIIDVRYAWGRDNAFKMVADCLPQKTKSTGALNHYRRLIK